MKTAEDRAQQSQAIQWDNPVVNMKEPTDQQLKQALAKMLAENNELPTSWRLDTELLHICHLIEQELSEEQWLDYIRTLDEDVIRGLGGKYQSMQDVCHASWQQRTFALAKVKGVEI